jgi:type VI secretion system FHA domain protein
VPLSIKILKKVGGRSDMIASRSWPHTKISIGRGEECTLVLEDPKKHVSRVHVELEDKDEGTFHLTVVSKVNPIFINGKRQPPGSQIDLRAGDRFELGEYELELLAPPDEHRVSQVSEVEETTRPNNPMLQVPRQDRTVPVEPLEPSPPPPVEEPAFDRASLPPVEPGLFDEPEPAPAPAAKPAAPPPAAKPAPPPPAAKAPPPKESVFEEATFIGQPSPFAKPAPSPAPAAAPPPAAAPAANVFEEATFIGQPDALAVTNILDEATYVGGRPPAPGPAHAPAAPAASAPSMRAAVQAFLEGAGLEGKEIPEAEMEAFLRQAGRLMRSAVEGSMALLAARATAKKELRAEDRTMVASRDNNPLKLMADPQEALAFLLDTQKDRTGGFLDPVQSVADAFEDLRAHEVALFAAMRAALLGAIQRFDPKTLEAELEKSSGGLGLNRKAKLWELFASYQQKLAQDAEDDFNKVFGREFMGTYTAQVKRLKGGG